MSGTNFGTGVSTRKKYSGSTTATDYSRINAATKIVNRTAVIRCDAQTSETETEFTLPANAIVRDVYLNVIVVDATETTDVGTTGTSNDPDGFLADASLATAGIVRGTTTVTVGGNNTYLASTTKGALLATLTPGENVAAGGDGAIEYHNDVTAGGDTVSYTCSAGSDTAVFDIIIEYSEVITEVS